MQKKKCRRFGEPRSSRAADLAAITSGQTNLAPHPSFETVSGSLAQSWTSCVSSGAATLATAEDPDTREGERATAYASALSGSFGYTIGVKGIYGWDNPAIYSNTYQQNKSQADEDLARLGGLFRGAPWTDLEPRHNLIYNNVAVNTATTNPITTNASPANEKKRMLLAGNSSYALIYIPGVDPTTSTSVQIKTANVSNALPGLNCTSAWSKAWVNPRTQGQDLDVTCTSGAGFITLKRQLGCPAGASSCDWILRLTKATSASSASLNAVDPEVNVESNFNDLEVWTELSADSATSAVMGQVIDPNGTPVTRPFVVSPDGTSFQKLPKPARDGAGNFFITWEGESPVKGLDEIFAQRYDSEGTLLQDTFAVSTAAEGQQAEPSVTADRDDNFVVSWTRYPLADDPVTDPGSIKVQAFDANGDPAGAAIDLPSQSGGVPTMSLVQADGDGNLWVAWTEEDRENGGGDVYAQRILQGGTPYGQPFKVNSTHDGVGRLVALQVESDGSFRLVWEGLDVNGEDKGLRARPYDADGNSTGAESAVSSLD
ncbi:MAG: hypothetical protein ABIS20_14320 [Thermoanaerobaculia bacterium]